MPNEREIISVDPDGIDGAKTKIIRHLNDLVRGQLDFQAIRRGVKCILHETMTSNLQSSGINAVERSINAFGIANLNITTFRINIPLPVIKDYFPEKNFLIETVHFIDFPTNSRLEILLHNGTKKSNRLHTSQMLKEQTKAIAAFTGPTSLRESDYPNNGFYYCGQVIKSFEGATTRKGAMAILKNGDVSLVTDDEKLQFIKGQYNEVSVLVGTSFYITNRDLPENKEINKYNGRSKLSYIAQYQLINGSKHIIFVLASMSSRRTMKDYLDKYHYIINADSYIALELERDQADCFIKSKNGISSIDYEGFYQKPDHYIVTIPAEG